MFFTHFHSLSFKLPFLSYHSDGYSKSFFFDNQPKFCIHTCFSRDLCVLVVVDYRFLFICVDTLIEHLIICYTKITVGVWFICFSIPVMINV